MFEKRFGHGTRERSRVGSESILTESRQLLSGDQSKAKDRCGGEQSLTREFVGDRQRHAQVDVHAVIIYNSRL